MKHTITPRSLKTFQVAPRTGAWIETFPARVALPISFVAPRTGAWIETISANLSNASP